MGLRQIADFSIAEIADHEQTEILATYIHPDHKTDGGAAVWAYRKSESDGRIVNIGSISAKVPRSECPSYTASKFGLQGLTHALAVDGRDHSIAVSIFHPGIVATEIMPGSVKLPENFAATPEEIAEVIVHMCDLPDHLNFYEALVVQNKLPFLGRG